jgi:hypothetical protein
VKSLERHNSLVLTVCGVRRVLSLTVSVSVFQVITKDISRARPNLNSSLTILWKHQLYIRQSKRCGE